MPRIFDYEKGFTEDGTAYWFDPIKNGRNEINIEHYGAVHYLTCLSFAPQFELHVKTPQSRTIIDDAFDWLSTNSTGPWLLIETVDYNEEESNSDDDMEEEPYFKSQIYIERETDEKSFKAIFGQHFEYKALTKAQLDEIAVLRGVLPPHDLTDHIPNYVHNFNYHMMHGGNISIDKNRSLCYIDIESESLRKEFKLAWGHLFMSPENHGLKPGVTGHMHFGTFDGVYMTDVRHLDEVEKWIEQNVPLIVDNSHPHEVLIKLKDIEFLRNIQDAFLPYSSWNAATLTLSVPKQGLPGIRPIPKDFKEYLSGKRTFYSAPYYTANMPSIPDERPNMNGDVNLVL